MRLTTIRFSHYNEKARWALDRFGIAYRENGYMPIIHFLPALIASGGKGKADGQSSRFSTPILRTDRGEVLCDSGDILRYVSDRFAPPGQGLFPDDKISADMALFNEILAPATRLVAYHHLLPHRALAMSLARRNVGKLQRMLFGAMFFGGRIVMRRRLGITDAAARESTAIIRRESAKLGERLADGRRFVSGERFTAADICFACSLAPILLVTREEGYGAALPLLEEVPDEMAQLVREIRQSPAGRLALRLFREERGRPVRQIG